MSEFGGEVLESARRRVGMPFRHHFKPDNTCEGGQITVDSCMERGMDPSGYDCSGLVIASISDVLAVDPREWPRDLRHTKQLDALAAVQDFEPGDILMHHSSNGRIHMSIATGEREGIHASGVTKLVEEGEVTDKYGPFAAVQAIAVDALYHVIRKRGI